MADAYAGLLCIGDPHLETRQPEFRRDDYPRVILDKLAWCLEYATEHRLLPALLGDLFDKPRDNATWMLGALIDLFGRHEVVSIHGNHDCADPQLTEHDSMSLLYKSGVLRRLTAEEPWRGSFGEIPVVVGGSSYREPIPECFERPNGGFVIWLTHHDIRMPGYDGTWRVEPKPLAGIDLVVNGHIHRELEPVTCAETTWVTPGNIARRARGAAAESTPGVLRVEPTDGQLLRSRIPVPHAPAAEVFHDVVAEAAEERGTSRFVAGLEELQARRTDSAAGLRVFLDRNLGQFEDDVAAEIRRLAEEVMLS